MKMTGRELIIYILKNNLENEEVFSDGFFIGMMSEKEASVKFGVGVATIHVWYQLGVLPGFEMGGELYFPKDAKCPATNKNGS